MLPARKAFTVHSVELVGQGNVDRIDIGVVEKHVVGVIGALGTPTESVGLGGLWSTARDCGKTRVTRS